jgi:hypothetical protein
MYELQKLVAAAFIFAFLIIVRTSLTLSQADPLQSSRCPGKAFADTPFWNKARPKTSVDAQNILNYFESHSSEEPLHEINLTLASEE